jgi:excisionase family DNA binding protein
LARQDADPPQDPWLTLAEVAAELRVNPATVRLWIARGRLPATRPGQRKLLVRRSDVDRMLGQSESPKPPDDLPPPHPRYAQPPRVPAPFIKDGWSVQAALRAKVDPEQVRQTRDELDQADAMWDTALTASENAPPDPGFAGRVRALAEASRRRGEALRRATSIPTFRVKGERGLENLVLSYELRPGGNRPGPPHLWERFDAVVRGLGETLAGPVPSTVEHDYFELSLVMHEIADAVDEVAEHEQARAIEQQRKAG